MGRPHSEDRELPNQGGRGTCCHHCPGLPLLLFYCKAGGGMLLTKTDVLREEPARHVRSNTIVINRSPRS